MPGICIEIIFVVAVMKRLMMKIDDVVLSNVEKPQLLICSCSPLKYVLLKTFALLLYSHTCTGCPTDNRLGPRRTQQCNPQTQESMALLHL